MRLFSLSFVKIFDFKTMIVPRRGDDARALKKKSPLSCAFFFKHKGDCAPKGDHARAKPLILCFAQA